MKFFRHAFVVSFAVLLTFLLTGDSFAQPFSDPDFNCFSVLVGKKASADGSVLFAHNEDDYGDQLVNYYRVPRQSHAPGETIMLVNGGVIPQVEQTYSYLWFEMPGMQFSDSYMNEWGVVIASDACASREDEPNLTDGGIGYWLRRLVAERARTAKQGVKIAGKFISELGYNSPGRTYVIADPNEGWMLAAVYGHHWVAQRVPDDRVAVIPNYYTIGKVDLADTNNFLGSPDLIDYAIARGWYDPQRDGDFHFARSYSAPGKLKHPGNVHRMWRGVNLLGAKKFELDQQFPFAVAPKHKISIQDLMKVLRDHYEGTPLDKSDGYKLGNPYRMNGTTICSGSTQYGFVAQLRSWLPVPIGAVIWLAQYRPDSQAFIPWYLGIETIPDHYAYGDFQSALSQHFNPPGDLYEVNDNHAFWAFVTLAKYVDEDYGTRIAVVRKKWEALEQQAFEKQQSFEANVLKIYQTNPAKARELLTSYTGELATKIRNLARKLQK